jgi:site-specific DNA recombinase
MRAVIYARYSTDMQRRASIDDQSEICRRYIERQGWTLVGTYVDPATSGSNAFRPGFRRLRADAGVRRFHVVVTEAIDRLSRNLGDIAKLFDELTFNNVQIHTTGFGLVTQMHVGVMGMMGQMQLADIREKTRRGQPGRVHEGKSPGGLAYGYAVVPPAAGAKDAGDRKINPVEAVIVQRIFWDYAAGMPPRQIAATLNSEGVPGPGGRLWGDTTIRGQVDRGTGILNNTLYIGQLTWNACSYIKNPSTGKRVARINPIDQREITAVPELRIINDELWQRVKARQNVVRTEMCKDATGNPLNRAHRRKFLLSGLLTCGCCGAGYAILAQDRYGCANHRSKATCTNDIAINRQTLEARVLAGLKDRLLTPELVATFVSTFQQELASLQRESAHTQRRLKDQLATVDRKHEGVMCAIEKGAWNDSLQKRLNELEAQQAALREQLQTAASPAPVVCLHPNAAALYAAKVANLQAALDQPDIRIEAMEVLQTLIERIVLTPDENAPNGLAIELHGDLATILNLASSALESAAGSAARAKKNPQAISGSGGILSVVAGARRGIEISLNRATFGNTHPIGPIRANP